MPIRVEVEGHPPMEFPDGTDPAVIQSTVKRVVGGPAEDAMAPVPSHGDDPLKGMGASDADIAALDAFDADTRHSQTAQMAIVGGTLGGPLGAGAGAGLGELMQGKSLGEAGVSAAVNAVAPKLVEGGLKLAARGLMRGALGAQQGIRSKFPTVDLEGVALREGVGPNSARKIAGLASAANRGITEAAQAADDAGAATIQPREIIRELRPLYDRATTTRSHESARQIVEAAKDARTRYRGGLSTTAAQAAKQDWQAQAKGVLQGADPRSATTGKKIAGAMSRGLAGAVRQRGQMGPALDRAQELMALEKVATAAGAPSRLRQIATGATGVAGWATGGPVGGAGAAALSYILSDPRALALLARGANSSAPAARELTRGLAALMASHD